MATLKYKALAKRAQTVKNKQTNKNMSQISKQSFPS